MRRFASRCGLLLACLCIALSARASARDISIRIDRIAGTVEVRHDIETAGEWRAAERFSEIGAGWQLRTGGDSKALLVLPYGNVCFLKSDSLLTVDKLNLKDGSKFKLDAGGILADIRSALAPGSEFTIESEGTLATVRGTEFAVNYRVNDAGEQVLWYCCFRGAVELSNDHGPSQLLEVGNFVTVKPGAQIPVPQPSTPKAADFMRTLVDQAPFIAEETPNTPGSIAMSIVRDGKPAVAQIKLYDESGGLVGNGESDRFGVAYLPGLVAGTYLIRFVDAAGAPYPAQREVRLYAGQAAFLRVDLTAQAAE